MSDSSLEFRRFSIQPLNINTATLKQLTLLRGVGHITAERIISTRPYAEPYELVLLGILKANTYGKIAASLTVTQPDSDAADCGGQPSRTRSYSTL